MPRKYIIHVSQGLRKVLKGPHWVSSHLGCRYFNSNFKKSTIEPQPFPKAFSTHPHRFILALLVVKGKGLLLMFYSPAIASWHFLLTLHCITFSGLGAGESRNWISKKEINSIYFLVTTVSLGCSKITAISSRYILSQVSLLKIKLHQFRLEWIGLCKVTLHYVRRGKRVHTTGDSQRLTMTVW